jgi:hypothetical protein
MSSTTAVLQHRRLKTHIPYPNLNNSVVKGREWWDQMGSEAGYHRGGDQVESKSLRITTTIKTDYRMTLNCICNDWLSPNNNNEIHMS